jgi:hypothetical protein
MANYHGPAENRRARLKRRRREVTRIIAQCEATNRDAQAKGETPTDFTRAIRDFGEFRKWPAQSTVIDYAFLATDLAIKARRSQAQPQPIPRGRWQCSVVAKYRKVSVHFLRKILIYAATPAHCSGFGSRYTRNPLTVRYLSLQLCTVLSHWCMGSAPLSPTTTSVLPRLSGSSSIAPCASLLYGWL